MHFALKCHRVKANQWLGPEVGMADGRGWLWGDGKALRLDCGNGCILTTHP